MNKAAYNGANGIRKSLVSAKWLDEFGRTGQGWLRVLSDSMSPMIQAGDRICIEKVSPSKIHPGDIITFWKGSILVTHRIIRKIRRGEDTYFVECADRYSYHSLVAPESFVGKVRQIQKDDKIYHLNKMPLLMINRIAGITFNYAFAARLLGRKTPFLPGGLKNIIKKGYTFLSSISGKILGIALKYGK